jgi:hypothetical protein
MAPIPASPTRNRVSTISLRRLRVLGRFVLNDQNAKKAHATNSIASTASSSSPSVCTWVCVATSRNSPIAVRQTPTIPAETEKTCIVRSCSWLSRFGGCSISADLCGLTPSSPAPHCLRHGWNEGWDALQAPIEDFVDIMCFLFFMNFPTPKPESIGSLLQPRNT